MFSPPDSPDIIDFRELTGVTKFGRNHPKRRPS